MRKGDLADGSRVRHNGGVRTGFVCKLRLQAPTHPFERCSADTTVCLVDATTFCDSLHCVPYAVSFGLLASTAPCIHDFSYPRLLALARKYKTTSSFAEAIFQDTSKFSYYCKIQVLMATKASQCSPFLLNTHQQDANHNPRFIYAISCSGNTVSASSHR